MKAIAFTALAAIVVLGGGYLLFSGSTMDLLDKQTLSPDEIRRVANELLLHEDAEIRARASTKIAEQGASAVPVLKDLALSTSNSKLRLAVFGCLAPLNGDAAAEILEAMVTDSDISVRQGAIKSAAALGTPRAVKVLEKALTDAELSIRSSAAGLIGRTGVLDAVPALERALNDPERSVRKHAARSLHDLTGRDYSNRVDR